MRPLLIVVAFVTAIGAADSRTPPFAVGVMRRDGVVVPLAAYDGKRWSVNWPGPGLELQIPITIESVPKEWWGPTKALAEWQIWTSGGAPRTARVTQPDWIRTHCLRQVALRTDYRSEWPAPPDREQPYPKDGLAVSPPTPVEQIERVAIDSPDAQALAAVVTDAFNEAEEETAARFGHPIKRPTRESVKIDLEAIYAYGSAPRIYYVEAARGYRTDRHVDSECVTAFGTGWFARDAAGKPRKLDVAVDLLPCNLYGASYMLPLGVMRLGDRTFWIVQYSGWNHERFVIADVQNDKVNAAVIKAGGGC
jgi:hypothetical protein